ncbi:MAG: MarC family protein [Bauldia sp.]|nr:MarC family protein [Bauldia sp.]
MREYLLNAFVTLFVTLDPIGLAPIFVVVTSGMRGWQRRRVALLAASVAAGVLVAFALLGAQLIGFLGISLPAFRIAGGLLLFWIAFEMVFDRRNIRRSEAAAAGSEDEGNVAVFPLAVPLTAGPGAISATILTASRATSWVDIAGLVAIILVLVAACGAIFLLADQIERALGRIGRIVVSRLLGILLAALAVQFALDGLLAFPGLFAAR